MKNAIAETINGTDADDVTVTVTAKPLDARINIPDCPAGFQFASNTDIQQQTNITLKAQCPDNDWFLYFVVKVQRTKSVVVTTQTLAPGTLLTHEHVQYQQKDVSYSRQTLFFSIENVLGTKVKRRLRANQPLQPSHLCFVCKGDNVNISSSNPRLSVKTIGTALQDGRLGETILVQNQGSGKRIKAKVVGVQSVKTGI